MVIRQIAPRPDALHELVGELTYKPGWEFALIEDYERGQSSVGLTFLAKARELRKRSDAWWEGTRHRQVMPSRMHNVDLVGPVNVQYEVDASESTP